MSPSRLLVCLMFISSSAQGIESNETRPTTARSVETGHPAQSTAQPSRKTSQEFFVEGQRIEVGKNSTGSVVVESPKPTPEREKLPAVETTKATVTSTEAVKNVSTVNVTEAPSTTHATQRIKGRKGVVFEVNSTSSTESSLPSVTNSTTTTPKPSSVKPKAQKPLYTLATHEEDPSESFIESATTGKDYVFPIVLTILVFPFIIFIIRLIYKRGTQYTERQQYHRMYLIDGMYNSR